MKIICLAWCLFFSCLATAQNKKTVPASNTNLYFEERDTYFPGGEDAWKKLIRERLKLDSIHFDVLIYDTLSWTADVYFTIDTSGKLKVTEIKTAFAVDQAYLAEIRRFFEESPRWVPARQNGQNIRAMKKQLIGYVPREE